MKNELVTSKKIRALLFVRNHEDYARIVSRSQSILNKALNQLDHRLDRAVNDPDELVKVINSAAKVTKDFVEIASILRAGITEDEVMAQLVEQMTKLEQAQEAIDAEYMETDGETGNRVRETADNGSET